MSDPILEIAPGTGQATMAFAQKGYSIDAVELGPNLAAILEEKSKDYDVNVMVSPFESWQSQKTYKMIMCATAFHWLDESIKYSKCYDLLDDQGHLVLIWHVAKDGNDQRIQKAYEYLFSLSDRAKPNPIDLHQVRYQAIEKSGYFKIISDLDHPWTFKQEMIKFKKGFCSQSSYLSLADDKKDLMQKYMNKLFPNNEEMIESLFHTSVYIMKKERK